MDLQVSKEAAIREIINPGVAASIVYHDLFDYPLTLTELIKWESGQAFAKEVAIGSKNGFFFIEGRETMILKRLMRKRISARKKEIAKRAAATLKMVPWIKFVGITGALAMENADESSDVDLMMITQKGALWSSRLVSLLAFMFLGFPIRRFGQKIEKDRLCLNMWLDESDLVWPRGDRNVYTAHEIAQITPLVNKDKTYERFLSANSWVRGFWPNAVSKEIVKKPPKKKQSSFIELIEALAYLLQLRYMRGKITREVVRPTRAIFHPNDWSEVVLRRLQANG